MHARQSRVAVVTMMQQEKPLLSLVGVYKENPPIPSLYGLHPPWNGEMGLA